MGRKNAKARSSINSERLLQPNLGAKHPVIEDDNFAFFFSEVRYALDEVLAPKTVVVGDKIRRQSRFTLYDDPERSGVTVLEQRLARTHAQRHRVRWTKQDVGRIRGDIQNEMSRLELSGRYLEVTFDTAVRLGDADDRKARKIALVPEQESNISEFFCSEHEIALNGLSGALERFRYPYSGEWIPHITVGRINKDVPYSDLTKAVQTVKRFLPLTLQLEPLQFVAQQSVPTETLQTFIDEDMDTA